MKQILVVIVACAALAARLPEAPQATPSAPPPGSPSIRPAPKPPPTWTPTPAPKPAPTPAPAPAPPAPAATAADLPSAAEIFKRSLQAVGGEKAVRSHTSMRLKGKLRAPGMKKDGELEMLMLAPNRYLTNIDMPGLGRMEQGFDGSVGWMKNPLIGTQLMQGKQLEEMRRNSDFFKEAELSQVWPSATTIGIVDFAGHRCHEVAVKGDMGEGSLFFDVDGGLHRGMRLMMDTPLGQIPTTTRYLEHKEFDGVKMATLSEIEAVTAVQTMIVESVDFAPLDEKLFEQPADVKALVAGGKTSAPPDGKPGTPGKGKGGKPGTPPTDPKKP